MFDNGFLITIIPPIFAAIITYAIAKVKSGASERVQKAKIEAEINHKAMEVVKSVVNDLKMELRLEINSLKRENESLKLDIMKGKEEIEALRRKLELSSQIQNSLNVEISSLKSTIKWYEKKSKQTDKSNNVLPLGDL
jgi:predicted RNase H-like nuclease (RuvC/YqgF family)